MRVRLSGVLLLALFLGAPASAQTLAERLRYAAGLAKDLEFPAEPSKLSFLSVPRMAIYKPEAAGPFPALVLQHQCGGLADKSWTNVAILNWAKAAVQRGYVAFIVDSLGPRGVDSVCLGPKGNINPLRGVRDVLQAAEHLRKFDFVDKKRIAVAGYSWGAGNAALASSKLYGTALSSGERPAAFIAFYPPCATMKTMSGQPWEAVNGDIDRPLLVLMAEKDNETPPQECVPKLEAAKAAGAPVEWHVYPGATHCWDCENLHEFRKTDVRNNQVVYYYDKQATQDSARRMFEFLEKSLRAGK